MRIQQLALGAAALVLLTVPGFAGDCSQAIAEMQAKIDAKLGAAASAGRAAPESSAATMHRQPTPGSITALARGKQTVQATSAAASRRLPTRYAHLVPSGSC